MTLQAAAQQALNEEFNYSSTGIFPPTGWIELNVNAGPNPGWEDTSVQTVSFNTLGFDAAGHDDYVAGVTNDFRLLTPEVDLFTYDTPRLVFDESLGYSQYMAHHPSLLGDGVSTIEATVDNVTWVEVWRETRTTDSAYYGIEVYADNLAGIDGVAFAFHYYGTFAHTWVIDNVVVDNGPPLFPQLVVQGDCPGDGILELHNMTPFHMAYLAWGFNPGSYVIKSGACGGTVFPLSDPVVAVVRVADDEGKVQISRYLQPFYCGRIYIAGFDAATCTPTNVVAL